MNYLQKYIINANVYKSWSHSPDFFGDKINNIQLLIVNVSYLYIYKKRGGNSSFKIKGKKKSHIRDINGD